MVKCPHCEEKLPRGEAVRHTNGRYYHKECYEEATKESKHYQELIEYICELYDIKKPTGMILMQIKRFKEEFDYTYKGMELTLRYFYEIMDNPIREGDGIGIIPYTYEEATEQYVQQMKINKSVDNLSKNKERIVYVSPSMKKQNNKLIDIESL